jgi:hypothetical protein
VTLRNHRAISILLAITALLFLPIILNGQFIWDDELLVVGNHLTGPDGSLIELLSANLWSTTDSADGGSSFYRPAFLFSIWIDRTLFGLSPVAHHIHSLIWHLAAIFLVWETIERLGGVGKPAIIGASLFALHPVQAEVVSFISARNDSMTAVAALSAILLATSSRQSRLKLGSIFCFSALAMFSKELGIVTPLLFIVISGALEKPPPWRRTIGENLPLLAIIAGISIAIATRASLGHAMFGDGHSVLETISQLPKVFTTYLALIIPHLNATPTATISGSVAPWLGAGLSISLLFAAAVAGGKKGFYGLVFAAIAFAPAAWGVIGANSMGFRYLYLPMVGIAITVGLASRAVDFRLMTAVFPAILFVASSSQLAQWSSTESLWRNGFHQAPSQNTACGLFKTLELNAWNEVGDQQSLIFSEAEVALRTAITAPPDQYCCLSTTRWFWERNQRLSGLSNPNEAIQWGEQALAAGCQQSPEIMAPLAISYALAGRWDEAASTAEQIERDPFGYKAIVLSAAGLVNGDRTHIERFLAESSPQQRLSLEQQAELIIRHSQTNSGSQE